MGQNVAGGMSGWQEAIQMWYDEILMWRYGEDPDLYLGIDGWKNVAHFTQVPIVPSILHRYQLSP